MKNYEEEVKNFFDLPTETKSEKFPHSNYEEGIYELYTLGCGCCSNEIEYTKNEYMLLLMEMVKYIGKRIEELTNE